MTAREVEQSKWQKKYTISVDWHVVKHGRAVVVEDCGNLVEVFGVEAAAIHLPVLLRQLVHRCPPPKRRDWPVLCKRGSHLREWACCSKLIVGLWYGTTAALAALAALAICGWQEETEEN